VSDKLLLQNYNNETFAPFIVPNHLNMPYTANIQLNGGGVKINCIQKMKITYQTFHKNLLNTVNTSILIFYTHP
jgi:hypothetical protein